MTRKEVTLVFSVGGRKVTTRAMEQIGPEDCYSMLLRAVLHRYVTGEDVCPPISREIKDALIRQNLVI